mmetsp:Transcript_12940/g.48376  ORF Transcript_12940/g.48376 Transcript_12940/m.48376 type:complete len:227 (-) Transcript_12940:5276-5956(-)
MSASQTLIKSLPVFSCTPYRSCDCHWNALASSTLSSKSFWHTSRACTSMVQSVKTFLRSSFSSGSTSTLIIAASWSICFCHISLIAPSLPSSSWSNASLISCVKIIRETVIVFCALCSNIHFTRGTSSYRGRLVLNSAKSAARMVSTTLPSHVSTGPSQMHPPPAKATFSFSPDHMLIAVLLWFPFSSGAKERLCTLSKHLLRCRKISCGFVPFERISRRSAAATK